MVRKSLRILSRPQTILYRLWWRTTPKEIITRIRNLSDSQVIALILASEDDNFSVGTPNHFQYIALTREAYKRKLFDRWS